MSIKFILGKSYVGVEVEADSIEDAAELMSEAGAKARELEEELVTPFRKSHRKEVSDNEPDPMIRPATTRTAKFIKYDYRKPYISVANRADKKEDKK